ncbi:hypothetical protein B296_00030704 [Ensete ventricosum]|uniref:Uncharacterized protein n=1 Tax=Ensete ventricosum TaxID=4639 RepID=A0A427AI68_ENSVE|nr:hypothetical protein B296_00030704 [Ensete ventricosum]
MRGDVLRIIQHVVDEIIISTAVLAVHPRLPAVEIVIHRLEIDRVMHPSCGGNRSKQEGERNRFGVADGGDRSRDRERGKIDRIRRRLEY